MERPLPLTNTENVNEWAISGGSRIFPGGRQPLGGVLGYEFIKFSPKLHEIEEFWSQGGGGGVHRECPPWIRHWLWTVRENIQPALQSFS